VQEFPSNDGQPCYHCFSVGNTIDECAECQGKPWSEEFLAAKAEIESAGPENDSVSAASGNFRCTSRSHLTVFACHNSIALSAMVCPMDPLTIAPPQQREEGLLIAPDLP
jgi:hypothetical protein